MNSTDKDLLERARVEIEALRKDAERYRAIRDLLIEDDWIAITGISMLHLPRGSKLDTAIDAVMENKSGNSGMCPCGLSTCVDSWEQGCGLGKSEDHIGYADVSMASEVKP